MNKTSLPDDMKIACCLTCTLGAQMRDCKNCPFQIGLLHKGFELIKRAEKSERAAQVSAFERFASGYLANIPNGAK